MNDDFTLQLAQDLIRRPSITPREEGCLQVLAQHLQSLGFTCERMDHAGVANLWARRGQERPLLTFVGHVDVVPTGPVEAWRYPPFAAILDDGKLYGRGAADMKSSIAAFVAALREFLDAVPNPEGSLALLITCDEEAQAVHGTAHVVDQLRRRQEKIDYCLVGEPTSEQILGDTLKVGRRGSLTGHLRVQGVQGHVAYPHLARNPVHQLAPALLEMVATVWDEGHPPFPPTSLQIPSVHAGTGADNVIPGEVLVHFNFRHNPASPEPVLKQRMQTLLQRHGLTYQIEWQPGSKCYYTEPGRLSAALTSAIRQQCGVSAALSTSGGTSDGRFVADLCAEVVEMGPRNATIHKVDEHVDWQDILSLARIYHTTLRTLLA